MTQADMIRVGLELLTITAAIIAAWRASRAKTEAGEAVETLHRLEVQIDGRMSQLLDLTRQSAHAAGVTQERDQPARRGGRHPPPADERS